eukprot:1250214-Amphidinium_carterae.1
MVWMDRARWEVVVQDKSPDGGGDETTVIADFVINAGGLWCDRVGHMAAMSVCNPPFPLKSDVQEQQPLRFTNLKHGKMTEVQN